jgi:hypothetical protein
MAGTLRLSFSKHFAAEPRLNDNYAGSSKEAFIAQDHAPAHPAAADREEACLRGDDSAPLTPPSIKSWKVTCGWWSSTADLTAGRGPLPSGSKKKARRWFDCK